MKHPLRALVCLGIFLAVSAPVLAADALPCEEVLRSREEAIAALQKEKALLEEKLKALECIPVVSGDELLQRNHLQLKELARNTRTQRQTMADVEKFVTWMSGSLTGYEKYIQAGSVVAGFARVLPIPYAGQASVLTKFVSQGVLSLNTTSASIARYLDTSQKFLAKVDALEATNVPDPARLAEAARFADAELLRDMTDVLARLRSASEISSSTLSFLESVNSYVGSTDEYWAKTKAFVSRKDADKTDKSYLSTSIEGLRNRAGGFNDRLKLFEETVRKDVPLIKNAVVYEELLREMETRTGRVARAVR